MSDNNALSTGAWVITRVYSKAGVLIEVKTSGENGIAAVDDLYATISHGIEKYEWQTEQGSAPKITTPTPVQTTTNPAPAAKSSADVGAVNTMEIVKVAIAPQADGKIKIGLFEAGHKYPDLYMTLGLDAALKALANTGYEWTAEYLSKSSEYDMHFFADWRNSEKLNSKGNPYKNVVVLRSAEAAA